MKLNEHKHAWRSVVTIFLLMILLFTYTSYRSGLSGPFIFDDAPNIQANTKIAIHEINAESLRRAAFSGFSGPLGRPVSMLSFAANYYAGGLDPFYFKETNLIIHIINGCGIFVLSLLLLDVYKNRFESCLTKKQIQFTALVIAAGWLLHPLNLTSVLYVVQRMTSLAGMFTIYGLIIFTWGRVLLLNGQKGIPLILLSVLIFTPLAILSKETGALTSGFMFIIEITFFRFKTIKISDRRFLIGFFAISFVLPAIISVALILIHPTLILSGYQGRNFTFVEHLMTEARVLWFYLRQICLPDVTAMGIYHDDITISNNILSPITTLPAIIGIMALLAISWISRDKAPLLTFGILFFLFGHVLESSIFALEIAHEHRNYLPMFGVVLPMFFYLLYPLKYNNSLRIRQIFTLLLLILFLYDTSSRANSWSSHLLLANMEVEHHPYSARANGEAGNSYTELMNRDQQTNDANYLKAKYYYEQSARVDPDYTTGLYSLIMVSAQENKYIDPKWVDQLEYRLIHSPSENGIGTPSIQMITCQYEGKCKINNNDLARLVYAPLNNPTVVGAKRAQVLSSITFYLVYIEKNFPKAIDIMYQTVNTAPAVLEYRLTLVRFLRDFKRTEEADKAFAELKRRDTLGIYAGQISAQEKSFQH